MGTVFDMPLDELRRRAEEVRLMCEEMRELVPLLLCEPEPDCSVDERQELLVAQQQVTELIRRCFRRMPELLPGMVAQGAPLYYQAAAGPALPGDQEPRPPHDHEAVGAAPASDEPAAAHLSALRGVWVACERYAIFREVLSAVDGLVASVDRARLRLELNLPLPWARSQPN